MPILSYAFYMFFLILYVFLCLADNILQDQLDILTYRVLAYLLLGVVRIYSKKVEYLFDDCQEVLIKINEFVVREKNRAKKEALRARCFSITRPVSFDLDAFDLEILEETSGYANLVI